MPDLLQLGPGNRPFFFVLASCAARMLCSSTMRLMTYNILCGGLPMPGGQDRRGLLQSLIRAARPDVLALQECVGFDASGAMQSWADALGLPHYALAQTAPYSDGRCYNITVFSRFSVQKRAVFVQEPFQTGALLVDVAAPDGRLSLCNLHLHAFNEAARLAEIAHLLAAFGPDLPDILCGDFNAISATDTHPPGSDEFERSHAVMDCLNRNYSDLAVAAGYTHPSPLPADHDRKITRRIDYIHLLTSCDRNPVSAQVLRHDAAQRASDHYPVVVDIT